MSQLICLCSSQACAGAVLWWELGRSYCWHQLPKVTGPLKDLKLDGLVFASSVPLHSTSVEDDANTSFRDDVKAFGRSTAALAEILGCLASRIFQVLGHIKEIVLQRVFVVKT